MMLDPFFKYYVLDFQDQNAQPELIRLTNRGYVFQTLSDWCSINGYRLIDMGESKPSGQQIQSVLKFKVGDFR